MSSALNTINKGVRVVISASGVHGTVIAVAGSGTGTDTITTLVTLTVLGDDAQQYSVTLAEITAEATV